MSIELRSGGSFEQFQSAVDELTLAGGGVLSLPPGTWMLTETLRLGSNVTLSGAGVTRTTLEWAVPGPGPLIQGVEGVEDAGVIEGCVVEDLMLRGAPVDGTRPLADGIVFDGPVRFCFVRRCWITDLGGTAVVLRGGELAHCSLEELFIERVGSAIELSGDDAHALFLAAISSRGADRDGAVVRVGVRAHLTQINVEPIGPGQIGVEFGRGSRYSSLTNSYFAQSGGETIRRVPGMQIALGSISERDLRGEEADAEPAPTRAPLRPDIEDEAGPLDAFCLFVGNNRTGSSLVGALLDAHEHCVVTHQFDIWERDAHDNYTGRVAFETRSALLDEIRQRAAGQAERGRASQRLNDDGSKGHYSHRLDGTFQGGSASMKVAGTKTAVWTTLVFQEFGPRPLLDLERLVNAPVRLVHVIRNPYDTIATMMRIRGPKALTKFFERSESVAAVKAGPFPVMDIYLEDLVVDPVREIARLYAYFGLDPDPSVVSAGAALVDDSPNVTRGNHDWTPAELQRIARRLPTYPWLSRYDVMAPPPMSPWERARQAAGSGARFARQLRGRRSR